MCDFAADAEAAAQLMVGRTLSVERVRELNAKDYFYQMLKDNPEMLIKGAGQWMAGNQQDATNRRGMAVDERMMDLRERQFAYDSNRERLREAMLLRGPTSRWA